MILIIGGKAQGKTAFAYSFSLPVVDDLQDQIRTWLHQEPTLEADQLHQRIQSLLPEENAVVVCREVGCGIVPMDGFEAHWRELVGRCSCLMARQAQQVYFMEAGIATQLK